MPVERPHSFVQWLQSGVRGEGERRQVTILACDTVGSSLLADSMDPEEFLDLMNNAFNAILCPVFDYGGYLARLEGDGFKAFFGAPEAHEDDPLRAVRAGLEIQAATHRIADKFERERNVSGFAVRVGVHTDHVVVGPVGTGEAVEYTAMGIGIVLAARLESIAQPGTVLISETTHRLIEPYVEVVPLGPTNVKGRNQPVHIFEVTGLRTAAELGEERVRSPLVGRTIELAMLRQAVNQLLEAPEDWAARPDGAGDVMARHGGIVTLVGEAGVGKGRLMSHVREEMAQAHPELIWLNGHALPQGQGAFGVLADLLRRYLGIGADDRVNDIWAKLRYRVGQLFSSPTPLPSGGMSRKSQDGRDEAAELIPHLANLLSLHLEGEQARLVNDLEPGGQERQIFLALRRLCERLTDDSPLVLGLDDLQWADDGAIRLLGDLMPLVKERPMLLVFSFRPEVKAACWQLRDIARRDLSEHSVEIVLRGLPTNASNELIENLLEGIGDGGPPETVRALIHEHSGGNPLFIEEVVRSLIDQGVLKHAGQRWQVVSEVPDNYIPETLHGVISARLDRLNTALRHTLQIAAVIGRTFSFRVLQAITQDNENLAQHLAQLRRAELVRALRRGTEQEYTFTHTLIQQVAYETLLRRQRREYHQRVAQCIEELYADRLEEHFERLAYHYASAQIWPQALDYHVKFATQAQLRYANSKATEHYQQAWEIVKSKRAGDKTTRRNLHEAQANLDLLAGNYRQATFHYRAALELTHEPVHRARLLRKMGNVCQRWGKYEQGISYLEQGLETASAIGHDPELGALYASLGQIYHRQGNYQHAAELGLLALRIFEPADHRPGTAMASNLLGNAYLAIGDLDTARTHHEKSLLIHASLGDVYGLSASYNNLGRVLAQQGEFERALSNYRQSRQICIEIGHQHGLATVLNNMSEFYQRLGQTQKALACQEQAFEIYNLIGFDGRDIQPEVLKMQVW
ncbi:MAG: tetratricopeptide repeat protein [Anaerolineae bacterium]|jgi:predicted ATPase/class 3 adenylate cyclase